MEYFVLVKRLSPSGSKTLEPVTKIRLTVAKYCRLKPAPLLPMELSSHPLLFQSIYKGEAYSVLNLDALVSGQEVSGCMVALEV